MMKQVCTLEQLDIVREFRCSVWVPRSSGFTKPRPAAFVIQLPGTVLLNLFKMGMYVYEPKKRGKKAEPA